MVALITGGAGFIGSHVARRCLERGLDVIVLDDLSGGFVSNIPEKAKFIEGSFLDEVLIKKIFDEYPIQYVYHLGAYAAEGLSHFIRKFNYTNNLCGSVLLINAAINSGKVERFIFTSSIAVYGGGQLPMNEETIPYPEDPYGISKYAVELDLQAAHKMFGLEYTIFRPHNVYGEHQHIGDRYRNVIGIFMNEVLNKRPMPIFGDGSQTRAFSYIDDISGILSNCIQNKNTVNQIYNIGSDEVHTVLETASLIAEAFDVKGDFLFLEARNEVLHAYSQHKKLHRDFGGTKSTPLREGIFRMAEWVKQKGPQSRTIFTGIEVEKNLPAIWKHALPKKN